MRHIILGAGAIGGTIGGLLFHQGLRVTLVARGAHLEALRARGLTLHTPEQNLTQLIPAIGGPDEIELQPDDVLLLATKTQDSAAMLDSWAGRPVAGGGTASEKLPLVCLQNGVENERIALRRFDRVYGAYLWLPAQIVAPGEIAAFGTSFAGVVHLGRYPRGADAFAERLGAHLQTSQLSTRLSEDIMSWKWTKLLANLGNALEALGQPGPEIEALQARLEKEGVAVLAAAGITRRSRAEEQQARRGRVELGSVKDLSRGGGSTWQSLQRATGAVETDYLNGEIVLLGRLHGVPTPLNRALQRLANQAAHERWAPARFTAAELAARLDAETAS
jgi:2-dehydropantoate 2-reductase